MNKTNTYEIIVKGLVQGIGYRPFVARLAERHGLYGQVQNTAGVVTIKLNAQEAAFQQFLSELQTSAPVGAKVEEIIWRIGRQRHFSDFSIVKSEEHMLAVPYIPADLPTCGNCVKELFEPSNRRFRHPFISCVNCGPRYSIIEKLPYDREHITMGDFPLCGKCKAEYTKKADIRRHAQTIACKECGPELVFTEIAQRETGRRKETESGEKAFRRAAECLRSGGIAAIKDIGGYHLSCLPENERAVHILREMKHREKKPFAVLFADTESARKYCEVSQREAEELESRPRPIVLLRKKRNAAEEYFLGWSDEVCCNSPYIGAMLCSNPLQILLAEALGPLVMTSANASGEQMLIEDAQMHSWMEEAADRFFTHAADPEKDIGGPPASLISFGILSHNRRILTPLDDSVVRIAAERRMIIRRARGFVPEPVSCKMEEPVFAAGGDLKACFCFTVPGKAYLSQPFGDLEEESALLQYQKEYGRMKKLFGFRPGAAACDMHPKYRSRNLAAEMYPSGNCYPLQHHQAHVASVIAEHGLSGAVLGIALDGTGYGTDGTIWGSEFFLWDERRGNHSNLPIGRIGRIVDDSGIPIAMDGQMMERAGHLKPCLLPGGDAGARNTDAVLYGYLSSMPKSVQDFYQENLADFPWMNAVQFDISQKAAAFGINRVLSSSMGRLFDAVSALLDICHWNSYEGEAPMELEYLAETTQEEYPLSIQLCRGISDCLLGDVSELFLEIGRALKQGIPKNQIARGFIRAVSNWIVDMASEIWENKLLNTEPPQVALSGGIFLNALLLSMVIPSLEKKGFCPYINEQVPPSDSGLALGQAYLAEKYLKVVYAGMHSYNILYEGKNSCNCSE